MVRRHEGLTFLYEAVRTFHRAPNPGEQSIVQLLAHTGEAFKAERAGIVFLPSREEERPTRTALGPGDQRQVMVPFDLHEGLPQVAEAIEELRSILVRRSSDGGDDGPGDAMVTPIPGQLGVIGVILVANRLGEDLLMASRLENGPATAVRAPESPETLLRRVAEEVMPQAGRRELSVVPGNELPSVLTDGERVHQILLNLVVNAIKYSPDGSTITLRASSGEKGIVLSVEDEGFGIPPELHEKIFNRLYQVDQSSTRAAGGVGLGLYISERLAETLGGRLWLERSDGDGSVFCLSLPWDQPKRVRDSSVMGTEAAV